MCPRPCDEPGRPLEEGRGGRCGRRGRGPGGRPGRGGLLEPALLAALADGDAHGYALIEAIEEMTHGQICADTGGVYRTLRRLEEFGCVQSDWVQGDAGPQRRRYRITPEGRELLGQWTTHLRERSDVFARIVAAADATNEKEDS